MTEPRRWTLYDSGYELIAIGPEIGKDESDIEVIEALPGVIIVDDLAPDLREAMHNVFTPTFGDAREDLTPQFFSTTESLPRWKFYRCFRARRRTLRVGRWSLTIERRST